MNQGIRDKRPVAAVTNEMGIHVNIHYMWIRQASEYQEDAFPGSGNLKPENEKLRKMKKKIANLEEETAILKKATANLNKHQNRLKTIQVFNAWQKGWPNCSP